MKRIGKKLKIDYNYINSFIIDLLLFKYQFSFKSFFNLINKLIMINYIHLNLGIFDFIYNRKIDEKYLFKFNINNENEFKTYYLNYDLLIENRDIMSYENCARIINDDIFDLVNETFGREKSSRNIEGRVNFFDTYKDYFVLTK